MIGKRSHGRRRHGKRKDDGRRLRSPSKRKTSKAGGHNGGTRDVEVAAGLPHEVEKKSPASPSLLGPPFGVRREKHGDVDVGGVVHYGCVMEEPSPLLGPGVRVVGHHVLATPCTGNETSSCSDIEEHGHWRWKYGNGDPQR
jgi:hypothetical protein